MFEQHRNGFMSSISCLYQPASRLLLQYDVLLRTDTDTFLTPTFVHWWPRRFSHIRRDQASSS